MTSDIHKHRCGFHLNAMDRNDEDPPLAVQGCGHEWEHARLFLSAEDYANRHMCPNCGAGPWYRRVLSDAQRERFAERVPGAIETSESIGELTLIAGAVLDVLGFDEKRFELIGRRLTTLLNGRR